MTDALAQLLEAYTPGSPQERADAERVRRLIPNGRAWDRSAPLHVTASALIVHPPTRRVLLRWHERQQAWLQVGGHADPGEGDPVAIATREGTEETGLTDLSPWPHHEARLIHLVIVDVPPGKGEPAHEHADLRFLLATERPDEAVPETPSAPLRWLSFPEAAELTGNDNVRITLERVAQLLERAST